MPEDEYTPQEVTVTIRTREEWYVLLERMKRFWRDTPAQQLSAEVEHLLLQYVKLPKSPGQPRVAGRRGPLPKAA